MSNRIEKLSLRIQVDVLQGEVERVAAFYAPRSASGLLFQELVDSFSLPGSGLSSQFRVRLTHIIEFVRTHVEGKRFQIGSEAASLPGELRMFTWHYPGRGSISSKLTGAGHSRTCTIRGDEITDGQRRLLDSVAASVEKLAWEHLRHNLGVTVPKTPPAEVFVSYRSSKDEFAESLARRLGLEGIVPFFDKWDVKAGDSIPGKIEEAFGRSIACILVLSDDYVLGQWATAEMDTAIVKRIQEGYKVIPVLYEKCDIPELLKPLRHVDFSDHDPQTFESKFGELIDAIYGLELNPFRS